MSNHSDGLAFEKECHDIQNEIRSNHEQAKILFSNRHEDDFSWFNVVGKTLNTRCAAEPVDAGELDAAIDFISYRTDKAKESLVPVEEMEIVLKAAKAYRASISNVTSDGWQPIETYLSNEDVDVWVGERLTKCHLDRQCNRWCQWQDEWQRYYSFNEKPTHWMPLPKPPSNPSER